MKITDPTLSPDDFGPLLFEPLRDDPRGQEAFALTVDGTPVAELAPMDADHEEMIVLDEQQDCAAPTAGCWTLELADPDGRLVATHILCVAPRGEVRPRPFSGELAVWATLTTMWAKTNRVYQRG